MTTPTWPDHIHGQLGVLHNDGERVQCYACGGWYLHLGSHTFHAHGLTADEYRRTFGLMQRTKLGGPAWLKMRKATAGDQMSQLGVEVGARTKTLTVKERERRVAKIDRTRVEHDRHRTEPERTQAALKAQHGDERGHTDEFPTQVADWFVEELHGGQRGVYRRLGDRTGVGWSTARSRVMTAVRRGFLVWTGTDREPAAHRPGGKPFVVPGSFEDQVTRLERWVNEHGTAQVPKRAVFEDVRLGALVQAVRVRYRQGTLSAERVRGLEGVDGWVWVSR
jgi:hypothetical protein